MYYVRPPPTKRSKERSRFLGQAIWESWPRRGPPRRLMTRPRRAPRVCSCSLKKAMVDLGFVACGPSASLPTRPDHRYKLSCDRADLMMTSKLKHGGFRYREEHYIGEHTCSTMYFNRSKQVLSKEISAAHSRSHHEGTDSKAEFSGLVSQG